MSISSTRSLLVLSLFLMDAVNGQAVVKGELFPSNLPCREWLQFEAAGFSKPVCGVIYNQDDPVTNGLALGGIDTGCLDLETSGLLGYCTIFNSHVPRRGPMNLPFLGVSVGETTWVLCDPKQIKQGWGDYQVNPKRVPIFPVGGALDLGGVKTPKAIRYWGHYPVADLEYEIEAPVGVALRAWAPFLPGDTLSSILPATVFEVRLRNRTSEPCQGTLAFSFPGPATWEVQHMQFDRRELGEALPGISVRGDLASYSVTVLGAEKVRSGGELGSTGSAWEQIATRLPDADGSHAGSSVAADFALKPSENRVIRFVLTWCAPEWNGVGFPTATAVPEKYSGEPRAFKHMYAKFYPDPVETAKRVAESHESLLMRILAWQAEVYTDESLPVWLRDSLVNVLYLFTEDSLWAQAGHPLPDWVRAEDGLFGMNECPRGCPQIECIPCSFYGSLPIAYFFPDLALSTLRGYQGFQYEDGAPVWVFGGCTGSTPYIDFASPTRGYQFATNGISLASLVDQFLMVHDTPDRKVLAELYPMVKKSMLRTVGLRTTPEYTIGERILSMPDKNEGSEWFEAAEPGWSGMTAHVGSLHLAELRIAERMAKGAGDTEFAAQCAEWIAAAREAMEKRLWTGSHYLNFFEPETGIKSEYVFGYQLDGEWVIDHHGLEEGLPQDRVNTTLATIKRCNVALSRHGAVNYANPDGTPRPQAKAGTWDYGRFSYFPPEALMLAMTYMYNGEMEFGLELARKTWHNLICVQGYTWDMPNILRGDVDTGERTFGNDYYQDMMLWSLPAAIREQDLSGPCQDGGLVARVMNAARGGE
ncbi:MAG: hypothetical protein GHCLOJNM_02757 [bacterium]|nr:hypothetical protein [bacterium]